MNDQQMKRYRQAQELIKRQEWSQASEVLSGLAEEIDDPQVVRELVKVLYADQQYVQAQTYLSADPTLFLESEATAELAVRVFAQTQHFMQARLFIAACPAMWQTALLEIVATEEQEARKAYRQTIQQRLKNFYHLGDGDLIQQRNRLTEAYDLPLDNFLLGSRFVLRDPFVNPLIKADIIDSLRKLAVDQDLSYLWIDNQEYQVNPAKLSDQEKSASVLAIRRIIKERLENQDTIRYRLANQQLDLQLMFLYPRAEAVITDPKEWAEVLLETLAGQKIAGNNETQRWQQRLMTLIAGLAGMQK